MIFQNTLCLEAFIENTAMLETDLKDLGVYCILEREAGHPVPESDKVWMLDLINELLKKKRYQIVRDTWDFIPERLMRAKLFTSSVNQ